ncbi:MAG: ornithine cyclodeaminase family protein [Rhizobacter sp.]|nr:ornithine cyclodeaminase family protein [Rhizobacter sp.]
MQIFDAARARGALPFEQLIPALRAMFAGQVEVPARHVHCIESADGEAFTSLIMPAWQPGHAYGVKIVNIAPGNGARGLPGLHASYLLHDATTGVPVALIDGNEITARRTAAASALAASYLARQDARHLLVVGAGRVARLLPAAYLCVRSIERVTVWARSPRAASALASELRREGIDTQPASDLSAAAGEADIVSCATLATEPIVHGRWLREGSHLDLIGSFTPAMREADDDCFRDARLFVDTEEALAKSGELLGPMERGVFAAGDVQGTLALLCRGERPGRGTAAERTVFKAVGSALEDLAAAMLAVQRTIE